MDITALVKQIQGGDISLYGELWESIKDLVAWFANRYYLGRTAAGPAPGGVEIDDLIQEGYIAMTEAVEVYDSDKGSFSTILAYYLKKHFGAAAGLHGRPDPIDRALSLDAPVNSDDPESETLLDLLPDRKNAISALEDKLFIEELHGALEEAIDTLPAPEAAEIRAEYWEEKSGNVIAEEMGVSYGDVRQLHDNALRHIRKSKSRSKLEAYLDRNTDFYRGMGYQAYISTHSSGVERKVIYRQNLEEHYLQMNRK